MWKMKRFDYLIWMILLIGIYCVNKSYAEPKKGSINLNDTREIKVEVTDNDGHVVVKEVKGEEMACILKCFPMKEKKCRTKTTPDEDDEETISTTPIPLESYETPDLTTAARMSTIPSSRSAANIPKKEQAVSAETSTEVPHHSKKENQTSTIMTTKRTRTKGSKARTKQPVHSKFETTTERKSLKTTKVRQPDQQSDNNSPPLHSDSLFSDLNYSFELHNQRTFRTRSPKKKKKHPNGSHKTHSKPTGCESLETDEAKPKSNVVLSERRLRKKLPSTETKSTSEPNQTKSAKFTTLLIPIVSSAFDSSSLTTPLHEQLTTEISSDPSTNNEKITPESKYYNLRRNSHEDYDVDCDYSSESDLVETTTSAEHVTNSIEKEKDIEDVTLEMFDDESVTSLPIFEKTTDMPTSIVVLNSHTVETTTTTESFQDTTTQITSDPLRRMPEAMSEELSEELSEEISEEMSTICDSIEDQHNNPTTSRPSSSTSETPPITEDILTTVETTLSTDLLSSVVKTALNIPPLSIKLDASASAKLNTESMRRMSESEEMLTDCESDEDESKDDTTTFIVQTTQSSSTAMLTTPFHSTDDDSAYSPPTTDSPEYLTTSELKTSTRNELSRRMSESEEDCEYNKENSAEITSSITKSQTSKTPEKSLKDSKRTTFAISSTASSHSSTTIQPRTVSSKALIVTTVPITDSMRRMSESEENSNSCETDDSVVHSTIAPIQSESMRRMSELDAITTEHYYQPEITENTYDELTEYVTECDTDLPTTDDTTTNQPSIETQNDENVKIVAAISSLPCCPDTVCSLLYPNVSYCDDVRRSDSPPIDKTSNFSKIDELRDMFYSYKIQILITKLLNDDAQLKKRTEYKQHLVSLWNQTFSNQSSVDSADHKSKEKIVEISNFLNNTGSLSNDSFLNMILETTKRIESDFSNKKVVKYPKLRQIILNSIPNDLNETDEIYSLTDYMTRNEDYEGERLFLIQLLFDIQERYKTHNSNSSMQMEDQSDSELNTKTSNSLESLQENGLGINMHRPPKKSKLTDFKQRH